MGRECRSTPIVAVFIVGEMDDVTSEVLDRSTIAAVARGSDRHHWRVVAITTWCVMTYEMLEKARDPKVLKWRG